MKDINEDVKVWQTITSALKKKHEETEARPEQRRHDMVGLFEMASATVYRSSHT